MVDQWLSSSATELWLVVVSALGIFSAVILYTRVAGLRSFSKMSSFDFASTVAVGSTMATVAITDASLLHGALGLAVIYAMQMAIAYLRRHSRFEAVVDNNPVLLMAGDRVLEDNLKRAGITRTDVVAKLREANVTDRSQILAVVLETTGDVSVLHGPGPLDRSLLEGIEGTDALA